MTPRETIETLLRAGQLRLQRIDVETGQDIFGSVFVSTAEWRPIIMCLRTKKEITTENVGQCQTEHWPQKHEHDGPVSPDNAIISLAEGHKLQTKKEARDKKHERKLRIARMAKRDVEQKITKQKWRLKKKMDGTVVRVRTS